MITRTKTLRLPFILLFALFISFATATVCRASIPSVPAFVTSKLSTETRRELARARAATARYHDVAQAETEGYVNIGLYLPGEGFHYVNFSLIDGTFDPAYPEVLIYGPIDGELRLVAVEYLVPVSPVPPLGFEGDEDQWRSDTEGFGLWELTVWLWYRNPGGIFADDNPLIP